VQGDQGQHLCSQPGAAQVDSCCQGSAQQQPDAQHRHSLAAHDHSLRHIWNSTNNLPQAYVLLPMFFKQLHTECTSTRVNAGRARKVAPEISGFRQANKGRHILAGCKTGMNQWKVYCYKLLSPWVADPRHVCQPSFQRQQAKPMDVCG